MNGICRICGSESTGQEFNSWVSDTFTNWDLLNPGEIMCDACAFWFAQRSEELTAFTGKEKPQRMQNYSHFIKDGRWVPLGKGDKMAMQAMLLAPPFPELAAITTSGQKHISFRAIRNPAGAVSGWVQFEEQRMFVEPDKLSQLLSTVEHLYATFSKGEIETGQYSPWRIQQFGLSEWLALEEQIKPNRRTILFELALFLAQRRDDGREKTDNRAAPPDGGGAADNHLAGHSNRYEESLSTNDLGSVREPGAFGGIHEQSGEVRQLDLFKTGS